MDLYEAAQTAKKDSVVWFPTTAGDPFFFAACMAGEAGEVINELKKGLRGSTSGPEARAKAIEEIADTFTYLLCLAGELGIDLEFEYFKKRQINERRFGNAT